MKMLFKSSKFSIAIINMMFSQIACAGLVNDLPSLAESDPASHRLSQVYIANDSESNITKLHGIDKEKKIIAGQQPDILYTGKDFLIITNRMNDTISIIKEDKIYKTIKVGKRPTAVTYTEGIGYVANTNSNTVTIIKNSTASKTIKVGQNPVAIKAYRAFVYTCNSLDSTISIISEERCIGSFYVGNLPRNIVFKDGFGYIANYGDNSVSYFKVSSEKSAIPRDIETIKVGRCPEELLFCGNVLYVANGKDNTVSMIVNKKRVGDIAVEEYPGLLTTDGRFVYVSNVNSNSISMIEADKVIKTIALDSYSCFLLATKAKTLYVLEDELHKLSIFKNGNKIKDIYTGYNPSSTAIMNYPTKYMLTMEKYLYRQLTAPDLKDISFILS